MPRRKPDKPMIEACSFDLECTSLNADFGIILCGVIKPSGEPPKIFRLDQLSKNWDKKRSDDSAVVKAIAAELAKYDLVAIHNGMNYDVPFLKTRMMRWRLPAMPKQKVIDTCQLMRRQLRLSSNSLARSTDFLGFNTKSSVDGDLWLRASLDGDKRAMNYIVKHCVQDVIMLEKVVRELKGHCSAFNSWGSSF
jgi:uncharacterized protein YprB with RNaseH-like and TPR domain